MLAFEPVAPDKWPPGWEGLFLAIVHRAQIDVRAARPLAETVLDETAPMERRKAAHRRLVVSQADTAAAFFRSPLFQQLLERAGCSWADVPRDVREAVEAVERAMEAAAQLWPKRRRGR